MSFVKKIEKYIYMVLGLILVGVISSGVTYMILDNEKNNKAPNENNGENKEPITLENSVKLEKEYELNDKIFQEYTIVLNNKKQILKIEYSYTFNEQEGYVVKGIWNQNEIYFDTYQSNSEVFNKTDLKKFYTVDHIKKAINENNFQFIKGTDDKSYLTITSVQNYEYGPLKQFYIINDNLKIINKQFNQYGTDINNNGDNAMIIVGESSFMTTNDLEAHTYKGALKVCTPLNTCNSNLKIENDKIYYLNPVLKNESDWQENDYGTLEERVYTINNNKLEYKVENTYKITAIAGQI